MTLFVSGLSHRTAPVQLREQLAIEEDKLPANCQAYLRRLEALAGIPLALISTGPRRDQTIVRPAALPKSWGLA